MRPSIIQAVIEVAGVVIAAIAALAAWRSARAAEEASKEARRTSQAQLVSTLLTQYSTPEMLKAISTVLKWDRRMPISLDDPFDSARRVVAHHFQNVAKLGQAGLLDEDMMRSVLTKTQVGLYCHILEPMEHHINPGYDRSSFEYLAALYGGRLQLPYAPPRADGSGTPGGAV